MQMHATDVAEPPRASLAPQTKSAKNFAKMTQAPLWLGVLKFGGPLVVGMALYTAFNLIDMFMVSRLDEGPEALAALGICDNVAALASILSNGISTATVALIARRMGEHDLSGVRRVTWQSMWLVGALSIVFGLVGVLAPGFIVRGIMQAKGEVAVIATGYLRVVLGGCFSIFFLLQVTSILRAIGHAKTAAILLVAGNALNVLLNIVLIFGTGPYPDSFAWAAPVASAIGFPRLGAIGAAWATLIGRTIPVIVGIIVLLRRKGGPRFHPVYLRPMQKELMSIIRIGWPSSLQLVLRIGAILVFVSLLNSNYTTPTDSSASTAYGLCLRLETMALFMGLGWGAAASTFVGVNMGAGLYDRAKNAGWLAALFSLFFMLGLSLVFIQLSEPIIGFFDRDPRVLAVGHEYLATVGLSYCAIGIGVVLSQAMTGAGATLSSLVIDALVMVVLVIPAAVLVTETFSLPRVALWYVIATGNVVAAVVFVIYYARGTFLKKQI